MKQIIIIVGVIILAIALSLVLSTTLTPATTGLIGRSVTDINAVNP